MKPTSQLHSHQIYLRFHVRLDEAIRKAADFAHSKPATLVADILEAFARESLEKNCRSLSPSCEAYRLKIGRSTDRAPRMTGKPMIVTVPEVAYQELLLLSMRSDVSFSVLRSDILADEMIRRGFLQ